MIRSESVRAAALCLLVTAAAVALVTPGSVAAGTTVVSLDPAAGQVSPGGTTTVDVILESASGGVGAFDAIEVTVSDPGTASITDVSTSVVSGAETSVASDGSSASVTVPFGGDTADSGSVAVATVTVEGRAAGSVDLSVDVTGDIADEAGSLYTVSDTSGTSISIGGDDRAPTASFQWSPSTPSPGQPVTFDASASSDPDGTIDRYEWDFDGDGTTDQTGPTVDRRFESAGEHEVTLTVTDDGGNTDTASETVTILAGTRIVLDPASGRVSPGESTTFDLVLDPSDGGVGAFDAIEVSVDDASTARLTDISTTVAPGAETSVASDGSSASVAVPFGGDTADSGAVTLATVTVEGRSSGSVDLAVEVTGDVSDEAGSLYSVAGTAGATLSVEGGPSGPTASFGWLPDRPRTGETVTLNGTGSSAPGGSIARYEWDVDGDGTVDETGPTVTHRFSTAGDHAVTLTVTGPGGGTNATTETITVSSGVVESLSASTHRHAIASGRSVDAAVERAAVRVELLDSSGRRVSNTVPITVTNVGLTRSGNVLGLSDDTDFASTTPARGRHVITDGAFYVVVASESGTKTFDVVLDVSSPTAASVSAPVTVFSRVARVGVQTNRSGQLTPGDSLRATFTVYDERGDPITVPGIDLLADSATGSVVSPVDGSEVRLETDRSGRVTTTYRAIGVGTDSIRGMAMRANLLGKRPIEVVTSPPDRVSVTTDRRLGASSVAPGSTVTVATSVTIDGAADRLTIAERFSPAFESVTIDDVSVTGGTGEIVTRRADADRLDVDVERLDPNTTVVVTYEASVPSDAASGDSFSIEGRATAADRNVSIDASTVRVAGGIAKYAGDDGLIDANGLRTAIADWAFGEIDTDVLRRAISAWATGESVG